MKYNKFRGLLQVCILVVSVFAFAYIIHETRNEESVIFVERKKSLLPLILKLIIMSVFSEKTLVSALEAGDLEEGVWTCREGNDGSICQEFPASECDSFCNGKCFPSSRDKTPGCVLGTCFDEEIGTCNEGSPETKCDDDGGKWFSDTGGNVPECQKGCCVIGDRTKPLVTERECSYLEVTEGVNTEFKGEIRNELACLALATTKVEGACVFEDGKSCRFITEEECVANGGNPAPGLLCTHPSLNMGYEKQVTAGCVEGKDELYWFDSEGNRENIYDSNKGRSWNDGNILLKEDSCSLKKGMNNLGNQALCGNCNRFLGSVCGVPDENDKKIAGSDFVCRDLRCEDKDGNIRENGESWCEYQGNIGTEEGAKSVRSTKFGNEILRSVDTPGSRHFRARCIDGEINIDPCADYRNSVCVEEQEEREIDGKMISNSACVTNLWQLCIQYNSEINGNEKEEIIESVNNRNKKCVENPHCYLNKVDLAEGFEFDTCVPKYAPGFDLQQNPGGGKLSCLFASRECTVVYVKEISGWKCVANCQCEKKIFAEQMNDLCISLGDCGASVNYLGELNENYNVEKSKKLDDDYLNQIQKYSEPVEGKYAEVGNLSQYYNSIGSSGNQGLFTPENEGLSQAGNIAGLTGSLVGLAISETGTSVLSSVGFSLAGFVAIGGVIAGAAIGFAVTALILQYTGVAAGLDPAIAWTLVIAGTVGVALIGIATIATAAATAAAIAASGAAAVAVGTAISAVSAAVSSGIIGGVAGGVQAASATSAAVSATASAANAAAVASALAATAVAIIFVVILAIVVFVALGVGDTKKRIVKFSCQPWQPKLGGEKCEMCGSDGYPCTRYSCQSLGQTCRLLNEGTGEEICTDIAEGDVTAPIIKPWIEALSSGFNYVDISERGLRIISEDNDGCLKSNDPLVFGINLSDGGELEPGYCRYDLEHSDNFGKMENDFGESNLFLSNHIQVFSIPDLTSLVPGYDPTRRAEVNLYVRCIDGNGNGADGSEFVINMCIKPGVDTSGPVVTGRLPVREDIAIDTGKLRGRVFTHEPATCRWSLSKKDYEMMENDMECDNDVMERKSLLGWDCSTIFPIENEETTFYIQCKDQPWYGKDWTGEGVDLAGDDYIEPNESRRNEMSTAYPFIVRKTKTPLKIDSITPNNDTLIFGVQPATVILQVETSGGLDDRATCKIFGSEMGETFLSTHRQVFDRIFAGHYEFPIECEDVVGNSVSGMSVFDVELDVSPPSVSRVYDQGGSLVVITDENAECSYINGEDRMAGLCSFDFVNGTLMSGKEKRHSASLDTDLTYYIKCKDKWNNVAGECSVIVRGGV